MFVRKNKHSLTLLYSLSGEYISIHRQLRQGVLRLKKEEIAGGYRTSDWQEINRLLSEKREVKRRRLKRV